MNNIQIKQIAILSGKGGTGKTTIASALSKLLKNNTTIDCDVDAANLFLLLNPKAENSEEFFGGKKASIDSDLCSKCGTCEMVCRFDAIHNFNIDAISCEGCGFCYRVCPNNAIKFNDVKSGDLFECNLEDDSKFYYGRLAPGEGNSGKMVSELKKKALNELDNNIEWIIIDGPPGIGCPVTATLSGADFVIIVTEPTQSGLHDLKRIVELIENFSIRCGIIINKHNLNLNVTEKICHYAEAKNIGVLGVLPFSKKYIDSIRMNKTIIEGDANASYNIKRIWSKVENIVNILTN